MIMAEKKKTRRKRTGGAKAEAGAKKPQEKAEAAKPEEEKKAVQAREQKPAAAKPETRPPKPEEAKEEKAPEKEPEPPKPEKKPKKKKKAKRITRAVVARGKRKESVARATVTAGKGTVRVNSVNVTALQNKYLRYMITEPLSYIGAEANEVDISVNVSGGGMTGQAQAARTAIANALAGYFEGMNLRDKLISIDRSLIIEDTRRVEPKKYRGPKARARFQKSYR